MFGFSFGRGERRGPVPQEQKREAQFAEGLTTEDSPHLTQREVNKLNRDQGIIPEHSEKPYNYEITPGGVQEPQSTENVPAEVVTTQEPVRVEPAPAADDWEEVEVVDNAAISGHDTTKIYANDKKVSLDGDDDEGQIAAK